MTASVLAVGALAAAAAGFVAHPAPEGRLAAVAETAQRTASRDKTSTLWRMLRLASVALVVLWISAGPALTVVVAGAVSAGVVASRRGQARRHERKLRAMVCEFCRSVAAELRSGATAGAALRNAVDAAPPLLRVRLRPVADAAAGGDPDELADVLAGTARAGLGLDGLRHLAACWRVVVAAGAMTAPAVDRIGDALADELELDAALAAALAGPRATWRLLVALPGAGVLLGFSVGADPLGFLFGSPAGLVCLVAAGLLDAAGLAWARRIGRRPARIG